MTRAVALGLGSGLALASLLFAPPAAAAPRSYHRKLAAADGTALALYRHGENEGGLPVLLLPEAGFPREAYDLDGDGLASGLAKRGFDVYVLEGRGAGRSAGTFDPATAVDDARVALAAIAKGRRPAVVAHGLLGSLVLEAAGEGKLGAAALSGLVALGSPFGPAAGPTFAEKLPGRCDRGLGFSRPASGLDPLAMIARGNAFPAAAAALLARARFSPAACALAARAGHGFPRLPGRLPFPVLAIAGMRDNLFAAEQTLALAEAELPGEKVTVFVAGRVSGFSEEYSHLGLVAASAARGDLHGRIADFLTSLEAR